MSAIAQHPHGVTRAVADVREELAEVAQVPLWSMGAAETTATLSEVQAARAQLAELEARLLVHAETIDLRGATGATSTATWLAHHTRIAAHRTVRLAAGLETRWVDGGTTNLADLAGLCPHHHRRAHDSRYEMTKLPSGKHIFHRRT